MIGLATKGLVPFLCNGTCEAPATATMIGPSIGRMALSRTPKPHVSVKKIHYDDTTPDIKIISINTEDK